VTAPVQDWRHELFAQISRLPPAYKYVLLFLDDFFLFSRVNTPRLLMLLDKAIRTDIRYLRLVPISRALLPSLTHAVTKAFHPVDFEIIPERQPYYSSLQVAFWNREHLTAMLGLTGSIWDFEHQNIPGAPHYAVAGKPPLRYVHVVEKGKWGPGVARLFKAAGLPFTPGERGQLPAINLVRVWLNRLKFQLIGYSVIRLKIRFRRLSVSASGASCNRR